uniref:Zinc finger protein 148-like n=1 Tax=Sinocyclocheilus grahami TaxID=75366 RepID=A0A672MZ40_SINGR
MKTPFQCNQCDMRFIQKYLLQRHEKIHTVHCKPLFCGDETNPSSVSPTEDFLDQVTSPKKTDAQSISQTFQIATFDQNFRSQFPSSRAGMSSQFSIASGQVSLRGHGGADFPEFSLVNETRSPDATSSQTFG